jgi:hypothetical protein
MVLLTDYQQQEEAALYSSLCLLEAQGAEGAKQIEFSKNMFRSKNNKALELVLYHCYSVVKSKPAAKKVGSSAVACAQQQGNCETLLCGKSYIWLSLLHTTLFAAALQPCMANQ